MRLVLALEITDRKRAEAELLASERRLRLALEAAGAIAFVWDIPTDTVRRYFSENQLCPPQATVRALSTKFAATFMPMISLRLTLKLAACLASGSEYRNEYRVVRPMARLLVWKNTATSIVQPMAHRCN